MSPRASLPGAAELFRTTAPAADPEPGPPPAAVTPVAPASPPAAPPRPDGGGEPVAGVASLTPRTTAGSRRRSAATRSTTGRERHEEKITVYVSAGELVELERARLTLRAEHGIAVDRGRIVREALGVLLADLDAKGGESILVRRLAE